MYVLTITINQPTSSIHYIFIYVCVSYLSVTVDIDNVDIVVSLNSNFGLLWCCVKTKDIKSINPVE